MSSGFAHGLRGAGASILIAGLLAVSVLLGACSRAPAEQRLRETIQAMEAAIEAGAVGDFIDHVGSDFTGNDGSYDRRQLHAWLRAMTLRRERIGVSLGPLDIRLYDGGRATVKVDVVVTGSSGGWLPDSGRRLHVDSVWREDDGDWYCVSANWDHP